MDDQVTNDRLIADFKDYLVIRDRSASTVKNYPFFVKKFADFIAPESLLTVNKNHLRKYLDHLRARKLNHASIQKYFTGISTLFEFLTYNEQIDHNPVLPFRKFYISGDTNHDFSERRRCISIEQARALLARVLDPKERAVWMVLFNTGMRLHELSELDLKNVDIDDLSIEINKTKKRSYNTVFFREENAEVLEKWLKQRKSINHNNIPALFIDRYGHRLSTVAIAKIIKKHAIACCLHNPDSDRSNLQDRFTTHCCRHANNTWLRRAGMSREFRQALRGDRSRDAVDLYDHIDHDELKNDYLARMPRLLTW